MMVVRVSDRERQGSSLVHVQLGDEVIEEVSSISEAVECIERHAGLPAKKFGSADDGVLASYNVGAPGDVTADGIHVEAIYYEVRP